ncbi:MAG TPA: cytochrome c [Candidatus Sulfotelmatobacter sp.]|nr:cytochrome c [Candidatus Sulfotelmatobacter sp.]
MPKFFILCALGLAMCSYAPAQQPSKPGEKVPPPFKMPPEAAKEVNPVKPTAASLAQGKRTFGIDCAMCHGDDGSGKGDLAEDMKLKLPDYRNPASLKDLTDGEMFYIIKNGKGDMPPEGERAKPDDIWNLVNYIRSFAKKESSAESKPANP